MANVVEILIKATDQFSDVTKRAKREISSLADLAKVAVGLSAAFTAAAGTAFALTKAVADYGDEINDARQKTGLAASELSALSFAAQQSGSSFEGLVQGLRGLSVAASGAKQGSKEQKAAFDSLGISVKDAMGNIRPMNALLLDVAKAFQVLPDGAEKSAAAIRLFGRSGTELIPLLNEGATGIEKLTREAKEMGLVIGDEAAAAADEFNDALGRLKGQITGTAIQIGTVAIPVFTEIINVFSDLSRDLAKSAGLTALTDLAQKTEALRQATKNFSKDTKTATDELRKAYDDIAKQSGLPNFTLLTEEELKKQQKALKETSKAWAEFREELRRLNMQQLESFTSLQRIGRDLKFLIETPAAITGAVQGIRPPLPFESFGLGPVNAERNAELLRLNSQQIQQALAGIKAMSDAQHELDAINTATQRRLSEQMRERLTTAIRSFGQSAAAEWDNFRRNGMNAFSSIANFAKALFNSLGRSIFQSLSESLARVVLTGRSGSGGLLGALPTLSKVPGLGRLIGGASGLLLGTGGLASAASLGSTAVVGGVLAPTAAPMAIGGIGAGTAAAGTSASILGMSLTTAIPVFGAIAAAGIFAFMKLRNRTREAPFTTDPFATGGPERTYEFYAANQLVEAARLWTEAAQRLNTQQPGALVMEGMPVAFQSNQFRRQMAGTLMDDDL